MTPWPSQIEMAASSYAILKQYGIVYLSAEERTGKLLATIVTAEMCKGVTRVLALTTKKALDGWLRTIAAYETHLDITATNYHQASKQLGKEFDLIILDECHNYLSAAPKVGPIWKVVKKLCHGKPIIYSSATPHPQGRYQLYHQFALSSWSPWSKFKSYYNWYATYGTGEITYVYSKEIKNYFSVHEDQVEADVAHLFVSRTRKESGFEHEPEDVLHYIELEEDTKLAYDYLLTNKVLELRDGKIVADTPGKHLTALHQIEGGCAKLYKTVNGALVPVFLDLKNREKIDYIKKLWGDSANVVIMYHYQGEGIKLRRHFDNALILQGTSFAEGIDLSGYEHLIIYSQDFRTGKFSQRRARQANKNRSTPIKVHFLLVKGAVSEQVYITVSENKQNFVDARFKRVTLCK